MVSRRHFLGTGVLAGGALAVPAWLRGPVYAQTSEASRPGVPWGVQSGDATPSTAVIWSATDRPARMLVEYAADERLSGARRLVGPAALPETGYTAKVVLADLPSGRDIFYRVVFQDLGDLKTLSAPVTGRLRTALTGVAALIWPAIRLAEEIGQRKLSGSFTSQNRNAGLQVSLLVYASIFWS
jgi:alkaline phosphatase D